MKKQFIKSIIALLCLSLVFTLCPFTPMVSAKTVHKTLAFDKKIENKENFEKGEMKNLKIVEKDGKIEMSLMAGKNGEYISPVVKAPFEALHIGLHWNEELFDGSLIEAYARTSNDGANFSEWVKVNIERDMGRDGMAEEETFASLVGTKRAAFAQAKIEFISEKGISPKLKTLTFTFLNSGEESKQIVKELSLAPFGIAALNETVQKTSPNGKSINVITREGWDADESLRFLDDGTENWTRSYHGTRKLIIHHTAGSESNGETDLEKNKETVRSIYRYHAIDRGWGDIGYNALVDAAGNIYEGRYGTHDLAFRSPDPNPNQVMVLDVEGAHAASYNSGSFGVSALGNFENFDVPEDQLLGIKNVLAFVADSRGIDPQGKSDFLRYDDSWHYDLNNVVGHKDVGATACPGILNDYLEDIKIYINSTTLQNIMLSSISSIELGTVIFDWSFPEAVEYQYALEKVLKMPEDQPWKTAWLNPENPDMITTSDESVAFNMYGLEDEANYVFYVMAINENGDPISSASHVNFKNEYSVIVDNLDSNTNIIGSGWATSTNVSGFYATNYFVHSRGVGANVFEWLPDLPNDGNYDVYVWYTSGFDRARNAPYTIVHEYANSSISNKTILVDQKINGGKWVMLDTLYFEVGDFVKIQLSDDANRYVIADAVKFTLNKAEENQCDEGEIFCDGACIVPVCVLASDCNDDDANTTDICVNSGTCEAACEYTSIPDAICGNKDCEEGEDWYNCPRDCKR
ncbi:N-acetylmuramoyl-L-alanine amidase [Candidatus Parcubacteria bacterium]|nr:N-acetylmuramoyl-L-alanine amidase [Candidatus Parcubacteria bacterium]